MLIIFRVSQIKMLKVFQLDQYNFKCDLLFIKYTQLWDFVCIINVTWNLKLITHVELNETMINTIFFAAVNIFRDQSLFPGKIKSINCDYHNKSTN